MFKGVEGVKIRLKICGYVSLGVCTATFGDREYSSYESGRVVVSISGVRDRTAGDGGFRVSRRYSLEPRMYKMVMCKMETELKNLG